jgi:hypothetical protein
MKWKGAEELRFAPGMFKADAADFFSYALLFWLPDDQKIDRKTMERELLAFDLHGVLTDRTHVIKADGTGLKKLASRNGYRGVIDFLDVHDFHDGRSASNRKRHPRRLLASVRRSSRIASRSPPLRPWRRMRGPPGLPRCYQNVTSAWRPL